MADISDLPEYLLQRLFAEVLSSGGGSGSHVGSIPAVCRQWRDLWADDAPWSAPSVQRALGSASTLAAAVATRDLYGCSWQPAWRAAIELRRNWRTGRVAHAQGVLRKEVVADSDGITSLDCDAAFRRVAVGCFARSVRVFALPAAPRASKGGPAGLEQLCALPCHVDTVWDVRWHGADQLLSGSFDGTIALHDIEGATVATAAAAAAAASSADNSSDSSGYRPLLTLSGHGDRVMGVLSCGPNIVASAGRDGTVRRWDVRTPGHRCVATFRDPEAQRCAYCVTKSPTDEHSLLSGHDGTVAVWDCRKGGGGGGGGSAGGEGGAGGLVLAAAAHTRMVMDLQLDESLNCLATASRDDTTKLWHWPSMECAAVFTGQVGVRSVQFDSEKLVTAANDRSVSVWNFPAAAIAAATEAAALGGGDDDGAEPEPEQEAAAVYGGGGGGGGGSEEEEGGEGDVDDDGGGTQPRLRAITPPRTPPRQQQQRRPPPIAAGGAGGGAAATAVVSSSLSPLRTAATSGVEHRPLYTLKHQAQVPRARFSTTKRAPNPPHHTPRTTQQ